MLVAYLNYPMSKISAHHDKTSAEMQRHNKVEQRIVRVDEGTISSELLKFTSKAYSFASTAERNDMWLEINFDDAVFELAILAHIQRFLGRFYTPFANAQIEVHR